MNFMTLKNIDLVIYGKKIGGNRRSITIFDENIIVSMTIGCLIRKRP